VQRDNAMMMMIRCLSRGPISGSSFPFGKFKSHHHPFAAKIKKKIQSAQ
jgi:hypothetical protein